MGLDMYVTSVPKDVYSSEINFDATCEDSHEIAYWRKHNALHGWMENLYKAKGGEEEFNIVNVNLTLQDIDDLELAVKTNTLPKTEGFFFGEDSRNDEYYTNSTLKFIEDARYELNRGRKIYYFSWW